MWSNITKYVNETLKMLKSRILVSVLFTKVKSAVYDHLIVMKLQIFIYVATVMQPCLHKFLADAPMLPFVITEIVSAGEFGAEICKVEYIWS